MQNGGTDGMPAPIHRPVASAESDTTVPFGGFAITRTRRRAGSTISSHYHEHTNLGLCLEGSFQETVGARSLDVTTATLICRPAGDPHSNRYGSLPARCLIVELYAPMVETIRAVSSVLDRPMSHDSWFVAVAAQRLRREVARRDDLSPLAVEALVYDLVVDAARSREAAVRRPAWLDDAVEFVRAHRGRSCALVAVADAVGVHPSHLARVFRRHFRMTLGEYVRERRLQDAVRMLCRGSASLAEIALATGFADQSHLSKAFKRRFGLSPGAFRREARAGPP
jgi:AraC family transcriptional regulator